MPFLSLNSVNGMGISLVPASFAHTYHTGQQVNYYQIDDCPAPVWQWAVIYHDTIDSLSRPSRELYRILCEEGCTLPDRT